MSFAMQQHLAPRVIQVKGNCGDPIEISSSILAGGKFSVPFTKLYLQRSLQKVDDDHPDANLKSFVDDCSFFNASKFKRQVVHILRSALKDFKDVVAVLKLILSDKAVITASSKQLRVMILKALKELGLSFKSESAARDLGVSNTAGRLRPAQLTNSRFSKTKNRIFKISQIAKISRKAKTLFSGSAFPAATFGHQACGFSPSQMLSLERGALSCTGIKKEGRCRATALVVAFGPLGTLSLIHI